MAEISFCDNPTKRYIVGAHYDSVVGTVGADDNASAIAVQLETARHLNMLKDHQELDLAVKFVSFPLEEPPTYGTRHMGSRVYAMKAWKEKEQIDGMICLEMVGYTCHEQGCRYPFPLMFLGYPKKGRLYRHCGQFWFQKFYSVFIQSVWQKPGPSCDQADGSFRGVSAAFGKAQRPCAVLGSGFSRPS